MKERKEENACVCSFWQILSLPALVWKQLAGEEISWSKDFATVDSELVSRAGCWQGSAVLPHGCSGSSVWLLLIWVAGEAAGGAGEDGQERL